MNVFSSTNLKKINKFATPLYSYKVCDCSEGFTRGCTQPKKGESNEGNFKEYTASWRN